MNLLYAGFHPAPAAGRDFPTVGNAPKLNVTICILTASLKGYEIRLNLIFCFFLVENAIFYVYDL